MPIHQFFLRHVTNPMQSLGINKELVNTVVFFISALAHEYVASIVIGKVGYMVLVSFMLQYPLILGELLVQKMFKLEHSNIGNYLFWLNFCVLGQPILITIYYLNSL